jgi:hypothetical protein
MPSWRPTQAKGNEMTAKMSAPGEEFLRYIRAGIDRKTAQTMTGVSDRTSYRLVAKTKNKGKKTRKSA